MPSPRLTSEHVDSIETIHAEQRRIGVTLQLLRRAAGMDPEYDADPDDVPVLIEVLCHQHWALLLKLADAVREAQQIDQGAQMIGALNNTRKLTPWVLRRLLEMAGDEKALGRFDALAAGI